MGFEFYSSTVDPNRSFYFRADEWARSLPPTRSLPFGRDFSEFLYLHVVKPALARTSIFKD